LFYYLLFIVYYLVLAILLEHKTVMPPAIFAVIVKIMFLRRPRKIHHPTGKSAVLVFMKKRHRPFFKRTLKIGEDNTPPTPIPGRMVCFEEPAYKPMVVFNKKDRFQFGGGFT
jgi:hypothetical protein